MAPGDGSGNTGNFRLGAKTLAYPDWVRDSAQTQISNLLESQSVEKSTTIEKAEILILLTEEDTSTEFSQTGEEPQTNSTTTAESTGVEFSQTLEEAKVEVFKTFEDISTEFSKSTDLAETTAILTIEDVPTLRISIDAITEDIQTIESESVENSLTIEESITQLTESLVSQSSENFLAALGGVVKNGSTKIEGAEVKVIRESDNEVVKNPYTDSNGEWRVTVEGGPMYHVVTQHSTADKFFNALSKPFIDTSEPGGDIEPSQVGSGSGN